MPNVNRRATIAVSYVFWNDEEKAVRKRGTFQADEFSA